MTKEVTILDAAGNVIEKKDNSGVPDLDPTFLKSYTQLTRGGSTVDVVMNQPYAKHPWVYACVSAITTPISQLQPVLFDKKSPEKVIEDHPILDLFQRPNPMMTGSEFFEAVMLCLLLPATFTPGGQCFILTADDNGEPVDLVKGKIPTSLYPFNDNFVKPKKEGGVYVGWEFIHPAMQTPIFYYPEQVIRIRLFNPYSWLLGLSPLSSLWASVINDAKASELSDKFLDNNATLGAVLTTDKKLTKEQTQTLKALFREQYEGWSKAGKTAFLHSGLQLQQAARSLADLQFVDQRTMNREEIMGVYGVGKTILGLTDTVNRSTAMVEKEIFWEDTLIPYIKKIWNGLNPQFIRYTGKRNLRGKFDLSDVEALKKNQEIKIKNARLLTDMGVPANTAFRHTDLDMPTEDMPWLDRPWVKPPRVDLENGETVGSPVPAPAPGGGKGTKNVAPTVRTTDKEQLWYDYVAKVLNKPEKKFRREYVAYMHDQRNAFLDKVDKWEEQNKSKKEIKTVPSVNDFMINKKVQDGKFIKMADPIYQETIELQAASLADTLGELTQFDSTGSTAKRIKASRNKFLKGLNTDTFTTLRKEINKIIKKNPDATVPQLAKLIKQAERAVYDARIASTAKTVARTETSAVASHSRNEIMKEEGVNKHEWVAAVDEKTRETHLSENGQIVKIGEEFPFTGLRYPLESGGDPEEVINCRCTTVPVVE